MIIFKRFILVALTLLFLLFGMTFALQNETAVPLDLIVFSLPAHSVALWVLLALCVGAVLGILASSLMMMRVRRDNFALRRKLQKLEKQNQQLPVEQAKTT